jgi:uncharacterized protein YeaC (DUF1315 family)
MIESITHDRNQKSIQLLVLYYYEAVENKKNEHRLTCSVAGETSMKKKSVDERAEALRPFVNISARFSSDLQ